MALEMTPHDEQANGAHFPHGFDLPYICGLQ